LPSKLGFIDIPINHAFYRRALSQGIGCYPTTGFQALVDWVENNKEPAALIVSRAANAIG